MTHQYLMPRLARNDERVAYLRFPVELGATMDNNQSRLPGIEVPRAFKFVWPRDVTVDGDFPVGSVKRLDLLPDDFESSFIFEPCISPKIRFASAEDLDKGMSYRNLDDPERKETSTFFVLLEARYLEEVSEEEARTLPPIADTLAQDVCHTIAGHILGAYASTQPYFWHYGAVRAYLEGIDALTSTKKDEDAVLALATALCRTCSQLREKIRGMHQAHAGAEPTIYLEGDEGIPKEELERAHEERAERQREHHEAWVRRLEEPLPLMDGMLAQDSALLELLKEIGAPSDWLEKASARAKKRCAANADLGFDVWAWWFTPVEEDHPEGQGRMRAPFVEYLLWALWPGIKEQLGSTHQPGQKVDDERNGKITTMPHVLTEAMMNILSPRNEVSVSADQMHAQIVTPEGEQVAGPAKAATPFIESILQTNIEALRSAHGMRLLIWIVQTIHEQYARAVRTGHDNRIIIDGGLNALRESLGITSAKASPILRAALDAGPMWQPIGLNGQGLWTWVEMPSSPGNTAKIHIDVGTILTPDGLWLHKGQSKLLTPIVDLAGMVGRRNDHAAVGRFQFALVHDLSRGSMQLPKHGGVLLTQEMLEYRAMQAGLPESTIPKALDRWTQDGDDAPALLEQIDKGRYHLADNSTYGKAREFLDEQGGLRKRRAQSGKRGGKRGKKR